MMKPNKKGIVLILLIYSIALVSCAGDQRQKPSDEGANTITANTDLVIGAEDQPFEHQFGQPMAVRVDGDGNIYVADRASKEIKVFDREGNYVKSLGGRGRGPGEFQDFEFMEWTPEGHLVALDRGNLQFIVISMEGEQIEAHPYNLSDQFYPQSIRYADGNIVALFYNSSFSLEIPRLERDLFHISSTDFQQLEASFMPIKSLGFKEEFPLFVMAFHPGSFILLEKKNMLVFSPSTYTGELFAFRKKQSGEWEFDRTYSGITPLIEPIEVFDSAQQFQRAEDEGIARAVSGWGGGERLMGSQMSIDAGLFRFEDERIIHFYAEWREGYERFPDSHSHPMDLYVQIFGSDGELQQQSYLFTYIEKDTIPKYAVVNWMDEEGNFYLLDHPEEIPTIRRFSLDLGETE